MNKIYTLLVALVMFNANKAQTLYFPPTTGNSWDTISPQTQQWCRYKIDSLYNYLNNNNTKAFIVLKDGKIVLEKYFGTHTQTSLWQWASAGKTITSFLVGLAQQENYLAVTDTTSKYLGNGWTSCTLEQENKVTIKHQLSMSSGLDDNVADHYCTIDTCLKYKADAGLRWAYHNGPYTLLDSVIEQATGKTLNLYATQKLKTPTGITGTFVPVDFNNVFFSNARSMARFGLLMLNKGNWNGNQIMTDSNYFNQMINTSQQLNKSYGYLWWLNGKTSYMIPGSQFVFNGPLNPNAPADMFVAMGKDGQFLNVVPSKNLVWVRMGESPDNLAVPFLLNDKIWEYINALPCGATSVYEIANASRNTMRIFPNPAFNSINIEANKPISLIELYNIQGQLVKYINANSSQVEVTINEITSGIYIVKTILANGQQLNSKFIKH